LLDSTRVPRLHHGPPTRDRPSMLYMPDAALMYYFLHLHNIVSTTSINNIIQLDNVSGTKILIIYGISYEDLDNPASVCARRTIAKVKQRWSVVGWVTKIIWSSSVLPKLKPLVPPAIAVVSTHSSFKEG
jgi:hypothetical protein